MSAEYDYGYHRMGIHHAHGEHRSHHRSWKKKYRKLKLRFDTVMKQSDDLFRKDIIATAQVKRIQEENVRLLDLLVDLNNSEHVPKTRRYNIGSPSCSTPVGFLSPEQLAQLRGMENEDVESIELNNGEKRNARNGTSRRRAGEVSEGESHGKATTTNGKIKLEKTEEDILPNTPPQQTIRQRPRILLEEIDYSPDDIPPYLREPSPFLLPVEEEEDYYYSIDTHIENSGPGLSLGAENDPKTPISHRNSNHLPSSVEKDKEKEKDHDHSGPRNPMSVYCWLKRNQPQVFLQDFEGEGGKRRGKTGPKRKSILSMAGGLEDEGDDLPIITHGKEGKRRSDAHLSSAHAHAQEGGKTVPNKRKRKDTLNKEERLESGMVVSTPKKGTGKDAGTGSSGRGKSSGSSGGKGSAGKGTAKEMEPPSKKQRKFAVRETSP